MKSRILTSLAALSLLGASGAAVAQSAAPLSLAGSPPARAGADTEGASDFLRGGRWVLAAVVVGLVIWGAIELLGDNEEDFPVSP